MNTRFLQIMSLLTLSFPLHATEDSLEFKSNSPSRIEGIIGKDDRVPSNDPRVGRIMPLGFTGWLISSGCVLTAGHCASNPQHREEMQWLEFNVPLSEPNGATNSSAPEDRYQIDPNSIVFQYVPLPQNERYNLDYLGNDWAVFRIYSNKVHGKSAFERQGDFFRITDSWDFLGLNPVVKITGYGADGPPPYYGSGNSLRNKWNQTQQTDTGVIKSRDRTINSKDILTYELDTQGCNSGSTVSFPGTHLAIGIHTTAAGKIANKGTGFGNTILVEAIQAFPLRGKVKYVDADFFPLPVNGDGSLFKPYRILEEAIVGASHGDTLGIVGGNYGGKGILFPKGRKLTVLALAGKVKIGLHK
jgi:V8-like Glu-specific endopeptidase